MRTIIRALSVTLSLTVAAAAAAEEMSNMKGMSAAPAIKNGRGTGVITAIDATAGTLTIQHGPIPGVGWPAMTMTFKAEPAALLAGLRVGQKIGFDARVGAATAEVTAVHPR